MSGERRDIRIFIYKNSEFIYKSNFAGLKLFEDLF